jgi:N6-adenosine-specific RNA methylase IME4
MDWEAIRALGVRGGDIARDATLLLWLTQETMHRGEAVAVATAWGFPTRVGEFVWSKPNFGAGTYPRIGHETCVIYRRGAGSLKAEAPRGIHSVQRWSQPYAGSGGKVHSGKPDGFLDAVERGFSGPYLEMFARRARFGWDYWGDESLGTAEMPAGEAAMKRSKPFKAKASTTRAWIERSRRPLDRRKELSPISARRLAKAEEEDERRPRPLKARRSFAVAPAQREKVKGIPCLVCAADHVHPAHLISKSACPEGMDDPLAVVPLCPPHHRDYDEGRLSLLEHLEPQWRDELAFAVKRFGLVSTLNFVTGEHWSPEPAAATARLEGDYPERPTA